MGTAMLIAFCGCGSSTPGARTEVTAAEVAGDDGAEAAATDEDHPVTATLVADTSRLSPGKPFALAVRFQVAPGWHIYWENPGDSGLETEIAVHAPAGFASGEVRYPGPTRFAAAGDIVSFGYAGEVMLSATVTPPAAISGEVALFADASWVACRDDVCLRGTATARLTLPVATVDHPAEPAHHELWARHRQRLPVPFSELAGASARIGAAGGRATLTIAVDGARKLAFFPARTTPLADRTVLETDSGPLSVTLEAAAPATARGVVEVDTGEGALFYQLDVPIPADRSDPAGP